jgi:hypothetical protein
MGRSLSFGSAAGHLAPFRTRVRSGSGCPCLNLATNNHSSAHSTKGTPSHPKRCSDRPEAHGFRLSFTPLAGVLFTVPSRYWFPIGRLLYLALGRGRPCFPPDSACRMVLTIRFHQPRHPVTYGTLTPSGRPFQCRSVKAARTRERKVLRSKTLVLPRDSSAYPLDTLPRFGLLPVRSPLLRESSLFLRVLRCFSSPSAPTRHSARVSPLAVRGCPIRIPLDHPLPARPQGISLRGRVLPRQQAPRHPPCAHHRGSCFNSTLAGHRLHPAPARDPPYGQAPSATAVSAPVSASRDHHAR